VSVEQFQIDARNAVEQWPIAAVGRRPKDFMIHDLLIGSMIRDPRAAGLQRLFRKPMLWIVELVAHLKDDSQRKRAEEQLSFWYVHFESIAKVLTSAEGNGCNDHEKKLFSRILGCTPVGALSERRSGRRGHRYCDRPRLCPFCLTRRVLKLWDVLNPVVQAGAKGQRSYLVRGLVRIPEEQLRVEGIRWWYQQRQGQMRSNVRCDCGWRTEALYVNEELRPQLIDRAEYLGISAGLTTYHAGPYAQKGGGPVVLHHRLGLLGQVTFQSEDAEHSFFQRLRSDGPKEFQLPINVMGQRAFVDWQVLPADHRSVLRYMLAGTSTSYPVQHLPLSSRSRDWRGRHLPDGLGGD